MKKSTYRFEVSDVTGSVINEVTCRCNNVFAEQFVSDLLSKSDIAAAAFGFEVNGHSVHSAYRSY